MKLSGWRASSKQLTILEFADEAATPVDFNVVGRSARPRFPIDFGLFLLYFTQA